jgi:adenylate cyclase
VQALTLISLLLGYVLISYWAFSRRDLVVPMMAPLLMIAITGAFGVLLSFVLEQWEKAHTRKVLNRFVSKRIAAVILKNAEEFEHGRQGERRAVTIVFSDIRSFTTWSESAQPEHLVGQLNEYFEAMVGHIEDTEGNAQKFIGDAILAAWGDTHSNGGAEDARRAVTTALKMRATLRKLNEGWAGRDDRLVISIGIGINHGDVVVGEVGHPERREYTVLGDGVNFAARLESATKLFHTDCLVGEQVEALTREHFVYRHVDYLRVKGKTRPVNVHTLISDRSVPPPAWLDEYHQARGLYVKRDFRESAAMFRKVKEQIGGEDFLCDMYAKRCELYAEVPPPADWDGSYTMTEK